MAEQSQFHLTVVTQKRILRTHEERKPEDYETTDTEMSDRETVDTETADTETARTPEALGEADGQSPSAEAASEDRTRQSAHHRRHYKDYGTLDLGRLDQPRAKEAAPDHVPYVEPSKGQIQREFYNKYNSTLNRRFFYRNKNKVTRWIIVALLVGLILVVSMISLSSLTGQVGETIAAPTLETIPVGQPGLD